LGIIFFFLGLLSGKEENDKWIVREERAIRVAIRILNDQVLNTEEKMTEIVNIFKEENILVKSETDQHIVFKRKRTGIFTSVFNVIAFIVFSPASIFYMVGYELRAKKEKLIEFDIPQ